MTRTRLRGLIVDVGGVLEHRDLGAVAASWAKRLSITPTEVLHAIYGGSDDTVLIGRVTEDDWWHQVGDRLDLRSEDVRRLRRDVDERSAGTNSASPPCVRRGRRGQRS